MRSSVLLGFALAVLVTGTSACGPRHRPEGPGEKPTKTSTDAAERARRAPAVGRAREILLGEMCPQAAAGRPAVVPIIARRIDWVAGSEALAEAVERRWARQFSILGWDGRRVGVFSVAGAAEAGTHSAVAIGSYAGASPCQPPARSAGDVSFDPACVEAQAHCGLALAELEPSGGFRARPFNEDPAPVEFEQGGACVEEGKLVVDLDRDGRSEAFPVGDFLDSFRAPAEEVLADEEEAPACEPSFAVRHAVPPGDPRDWRGLDVLGVLDIDGDGRHEVVAAYHYADRRTWAVYSPRSTAVRLELVGEGEPWRAR